MKEIRLHGRGGQGVVTAAQILVDAVVTTKRYAHFIPFFGVERKGSPVYGFVRIDDKPIRIKSQVYNPHCIVVLDDTLLDGDFIFEGLQENGILVLNSNKKPESFNLPDTVKTLALVDATQIAVDIINKDIPNTTMLGALAKATGYIEPEILYKKIHNTFGEKNAKAALKAYETTKIYNL